MAGMIDPAADFLWEPASTTVTGNAGDTMDQVCEGCHLQFWYPGQNIPQFPDQAPEEDAKK
jgi:hypothetical protein